MNTSPQTKVPTLRATLISFLGAGPLQETTYVYGAMRHTSRYLVGRAREEAGEFGAQGERRRARLHGGRAGPSLRRLPRGPVQQYAARRRPAEVCTMVAVRGNGRSER